MLFLIEWRAGLRISEALALEARDLSLEGEIPSLHVREGKGSRPRIVPVHPELRVALTSALEFGDVGQGDRLIRASRATADRWIKKAAARAGNWVRYPPARGYLTTRSGTPTPVNCWSTAGRSTSCHAGWVTPRSIQLSSTWNWCQTRLAAWRRCLRNGWRGDVRSSAPTRVVSEERAVKMIVLHTRDVSNAATSDITG